jgi:hypothetical protein
VVNSVNVSSRKDIPEPTDWTTDQGRLINTTVPLYSKSEVNKLLAQGILHTSLFTSKCALDAANEGLALRDVIALVKDAVDVGKYKNSQWCRQSVQGPIAPCDAYALTQFIKTNGETRRVNYYVKFAISSTGKLLLIFSCHG